MRAEIIWIKMNWDYVKKFEQFYTWWDGGVMDSTFVFDTKGAGFNSRSLQILLTSFFLLCQVLSKTNFPCMNKKTTSKLLLCAKFCPKQISPAYQHQTFPVNVQKNYIITLIVLSFVQNELGLSLKFWANCSMMRWWCNV